MEWFSSLVELIAHLDQHLAALAQQYGGWAYGVLFAIIFAETGLVVTPFLPGDSLLFVAGAVCAGGWMNVHLLALLLIIAAVVGNQVNFLIGRWVGPKVFRSQDSWFFRREYLERTQAFYERHGGKTLVISRFLPIVRTYAPFVAGIGQMNAWRFAMFNIVGAAAWVLSLTYAGYFFGNLPWVKENLTAVIVGIIILSLMPGIIGYMQARRAA